jgi:hypothetical protein
MMFENLSQQDTSYTHKLATQLRDVVDKAFVKAAKEILSMPFNHTAETLAYRNQLAMHIVCMTRSPSLIALIQEMING